MILHMYAKLHIQYLAVVGFGLNIFNKRRL
jgi:hypothetical protein